MKALSPAGLKGSWNQVYANEGPLLSWKIFQHQNIPNDHDEVSVQLKFHRSTANSIIVVASQTRRDHVGIIQVARDLRLHIPIAQSSTPTT